MFFPFFNIFPVWWWPRLLNSADWAYVLLPDWAPPLYSGGLVLFCVFFFPRKNKRKRRRRENLLFRVCGEETSSPTTLSKMMHPPYHRSGRCRESQSPACNGLLLPMRSPLVIRDWVARGPHTCQVSMSLKRNDQKVCTEGPHSRRNGISRTQRHREEANTKT